MSAEMLTYVELVRLCALTPADHTPVIAHLATVKGQIRKVVRTSMNALGAVRVTLHAAWTKVF